MYNSYVWVLVQYERCLLEFRIVNPKIIAGTVRNIFTSTGAEAVEVVPHEAFVVLVGEDAYRVGVLPLVLLADGQGAVCRAILADDDFYGQVASLCQDAVECPADGVLLVIGADDNRY